MRLFFTGLLLSALCGSGKVRAQLQLVPGQMPQRVFAGKARSVAMLWHNSTDSYGEVDVRAHVMQLTSATATTFNEFPWKRLRILPGQTVVESAALDFPAVRAETRFMVQWIENTNRVIGKTEVFVYPTNLLAELQPLVGHEDGALGVLDPRDQLKPLLRDAKVNFIDLGNAVLENFRGKLAIIGPFESKAKMDSTLSSRIKTITEKGVALVWIQPPGGSSNTCAEQELLQPSFYSVPENQIAAVIVQPELVANPADDPCSQLNLIYFCKLALHPESLTFPSTKTQP